MSRHRDTPAALKGYGRAVGLVLVLCMWTVPGLAQTDFDAVLVEAERYYEAGRLDRVIDLLAPYLAGDASATREEKAEACRLLAMAYIAMDNPEQAEAAVDHLLAVKPQFETTLRDPPQFASLVARMRGGGAGIEVQLASGVTESIFDAPATMVVVTAEEIRRRGYTNLAEVVMDLPGFDVVLANGTSYLFAYQRGYRTPFTQRTLLMVNNQVDNHLWTHEAVMTRQYPFSNVKKIEVLYGPASAVYGPNAFLGIINVVTYDGTEPGGEAPVNRVQVEGGSYRTRSVDATARGRIGGVAYAVSGRIFRSDEADLSGRFGYLDPALFSDEQIWGPMLDQEHRGRKFGTYFDPTDDNGVMGCVSYQGVKLGFMRWVRREGYGPYYAADRVQNNAFWNKHGSRVYLEMDRRIFGGIRGKSLLAYRTSRISGSWVEALPDWREGMGDYAFISYTNWSSVSDSWLFKQQVDASLRNLLFSVGVKFERKELTKAYDIPGYWGVFSSSAPADDPGPYGHGVGVGHSTDAAYVPPPPPNPEMPPHNLALTEDVGGFVQGIWDASPFRFNAGIRCDHNSLYGTSVNPRASAIYRFSRQGAVKLWYGEAFQEPAPLQLWGGWSGREDNPDLKPERARNIELILMHQTEGLFHDLSLYRSHYENVIKEEAENAGTRDVWGVEYRARYNLPNFIAGAPDVSGYFHYTFTHVTSSIYFDQELGAWKDGETELGDIAPHKVGVGATLPVSRRWHVNLRGNFVGRRQVYSGNPLRAEGRTIPPYFVLNGAVGYAHRMVTATLKVSNLLNKTYDHPGVEGAGSGDDFSMRSMDFQNSLIPQPGRSFTVMVGLNL